MDHLQFEGTSVSTLTREEDVDAHALHRQGWTISAIARHLKRDRKTVRAYLKQGRVAGQRARPAQDAFESFVDYCRARLTEDPHLWATTLFDEVVALGYDRSYPSFTRALRARALRPHCEPCHPAKDRPVAVIEHPPGEETQFDWLELPDPPADWGWGSKAFLLVGSLAHSGRWRGVLCEGTDQAQLVDAIHRVCEALGGLTRDWRFDRMATVCHPETGQITASFAAVAKHYGVSVKICPARRGNRKGVVEKANHVAAQRSWRTLADDVSVAQAQASLDRWCSLRGDTRVKRTTDGKSNAAADAVGGPAGYSWLGVHERGTDDSGLLLMGARLYNPTTGQFTSVDPVHGGNETAYNYPNDPINSLDPTGRNAITEWWGNLKGEQSACLGVAGPFTCATAWQAKRKADQLAKRFKGDRNMYNAVHHFIWQVGTYITAGRKVAEAVGHAHEPTNPTGSYQVVDTERDRINNAKSRNYARKYFHKLRNLSVSPYGLNGMYNFLQQEAVRLYNLGYFHTLAGTGKNTRLVGGRYCLCCE